MSGYAIVLGQCCCCGQLVGFNPHLVPSFKGEPVCEPCMHVINQRRASAEPPLPAFTWHPEAYQPVEAGQL